MIFSGSRSFIPSFLGIRRFAFSFSIVQIYVALRFVIERNSMSSYSSNHSSGANASFSTPSRSYLLNIHTREVILVSRSSELINSLQSVIHSVIENVEDLPLHSDIKAAILDTEYARLGIVDLLTCLA